VNSLVTRIEFGFTGLKAFWGKLDLRRPTRPPGIERRRMASLSMAMQRGAARFGVALPASLIAFLGVGMTGLAANLGLLTVLELLHVPFPAAYGVSLVAATAITWALNRRVSFAASGRPAHHEALRYFLVALVAQGVNYAVALVLTRFAPHSPHVMDAVIGAVIATLFSYTGQRLFTFTPPKA
jgi:putative flippase GtrA